MEHSERGCNHLSKRAGSQRTSSVSQPQTHREEGEGEEKAGFTENKERGTTLELLAGDFEAGQRSEPHPDPSLTHKKQLGWVWEFRHGI